MNYLTPKETAESLVVTAQNKVAYSIKKRMLMSLIGGLYIALGAQGFITVYDNIFIRAAVFPVGLMLIMLVGGEIFTGDCLMTFALLQRKIKSSSYINVLLQVLVGNLVGSVLVALLLYYGGMYNNPKFSETILKIAKAKLSLTYLEVITRGILCNILVSLGVWFATTAKDTTGKLLGSWFPVMLFVLAGYEHVVANMFYLPMAFLIDNSISLSQILINNFIPAAIGNFIGGGLLIPLVYHNLYFK